MTHVIFDKHPGFRITSLIGLRHNSILKSRLTNIWGLCGLSRYKFCMFKNQLGGHLKLRRVRYVFQTLKKRYLYSSIVDVI